MISWREYFFLIKAAARPASSCATDDSTLAKLPFFVNPKKIPEHTKVVAPEDVEIRQVNEKLDAAAKATPTN